MIADIGVPMLYLQLPLLTIVLLPVIALETLVLQRRLRLPVGRALVGATLANLASTFVGFPLAWSALFLLQLVTGGLRSWGLGNPALRVAAVTWQAPWLVPYDDDLYWMIPAASLTLLVPCFPVSAWMEGRLLRWLWADANVKPAQIGSAVWLANGVSYGLLFALATLRLCLALAGVGVEPVP
jgi:hypothetical protein